uniref:Uncharacterized protein n=1 Tax=Rhizophora mucronata TaxID=61149 RepID=A0A2P2NS70_RHIMU
MSLCPSWLNSWRFGSHLHFGCCFVPDFKT